MVPSNQATRRRGQAHTSKQHDFKSVVTTICILAFGNTVVISSIISTMLLYTNHAHFTTATDSTVYVITLSLGLITPAFFSIPLGELSSRFGNGRTIVMAYGIAICGALIMIFSQFNKYAYMVGYTLCSIANSLRLMRFTVIGEVVPAQHRSKALALHQLAVPLGLLVGPLSWLFFQQWRMEKVIWPSLFVLNRFSMLYMFCIVVLVAVSVLALTQLVHVRRADADPDTVGAEIAPADTSYGSTDTSQSAHTAPSGSAPAQARAVHDGNLATTMKVSDILRNGRFIYFSIVFLCVRFTFSIAKIVFQPALITHFGADDAEVGRLFALSAVAIFFSPLLVLALSPVVQDRHILLCGVILKVVGIMLYVPIFGPVNKWQTVIGYICVMKATILSTTGSISIFSKSMGKKFSGKVMGYMWAFANAFPALVQITFSNGVVSLFSSWQFVVFAIPSTVSLCMVVAPRGWQSLDIDNGAHGEERGIQREITA